jgi:NAD(P) transhydrogenase subunit beta
LVATVLDVLIGGVTFSGSLIAAGKLEGWISGRPLVLPGGRVITAFLAAGALGGSSYLLSGADSTGVLIGVTLAALAFGITMVLPIGGADMPVVISLLNAFTEQTT